MSSALPGEHDPAQAPDQFLKGWAAEAEKFKEQPRFSSTQLHKVSYKS
jgi:hypothetical protein